MLITGRTSASLPRLRVPNGRAGALSLQPHSAALPQGPAARRKSPLNEGKNERVSDGQTDERAQGPRNIQYLSKEVQDGQLSFLAGRRGSRPRQLLATNPETRGGSHRSAARARQPRGFLKSIESDARIWETSHHGL